MKDTHERVRFCQELAKASRSSSEEIGKSKTFSERMTHRIASFADYAHSFLQMVANAKASGDEIAALQMRQMEMEFEMGDS